MFEALVITLREGAEAALVLAIAASLLRRRGLARLQSALLGGAALAVVASGVVAWLASRITVNEELTEGIAMLVGCVLVLTLTWWMWRAAPRMKAEIESGIDRATAAAGSGAVSAFPVFAFGFLMVLREGGETAIFLSAAGFNSQGLGLWLGAFVGLGIAATFGVLFARGAFKIPLKPFFSVTSAVLVLIALQLLVGGLHELSEAQVLPSSRAEMALIGPFIKNELLLFTLTVALAVGWLLAGPRATGPAPEATGPQARLDRAAHASETARRRWTAILGVVLVGCLATAFVQRSRTPARPPAEELALREGFARLDPARLADGHPHFYQVTLPERPVRFFAIDVGGEVRTCLDACVICGDKGYFEERGALVCRNCTSPISRSSLGRSGGCNPIPLPHALEAGAVTVREADLRAALPRLGGRH